MTTLKQNCEQIVTAFEALQQAFGSIRPHFGDLSDESLIAIAREVTKGRPRGAAVERPETPLPPDEVMVNGKSNGAQAKVEDVITSFKMPRQAKKLARNLRKNFQGKTFNLGDVGESMGIESRKLIPYMVACEKNGLVKKAGKGKRNGQEVNLYKLGDPLVVNG